MISRREFLRRTGTNAAAAGFLSKSPEDLVKLYPLAVVRFARLCASPWLTAPAQRGVVGPKAHQPANRLII